MSVIIRNEKQLKQAKEDYEALHKAWLKALSAQSYTMSENQLTRASLKEIQEEMSEYRTAIDAYESHGSTDRRTSRVVPLG